MSTVKGVRRTFILTLDRDRHHETLEMGTKRNRLCSASFLIGINIVFLASLSTTAETGRLHPRCRASIRTLNGPLCGPGACWGPISRPRSVTDDGPGL